METRNRDASTLRCRAYSFARIEAIFYCFVFFYLVFAGLHRRLTTGPGSLGVGVFRKGCMKASSL